MNMFMENSVPFLRHFEDVDSEVGDVYSCGWAVFRGYSGFTGSGNYTWKYVNIHWESRVSTVYDTDGHVAGELLCLRMPAAYTRRRAGDFVASILQNR